ncbi:MAG: DUF501 domain-containing protein [Actinomycetaceae bacterium]|nr:DUF501 domain-containing protein [Actinomycetaceae bacterium]
MAVNEQVTADLLRRVAAHATPVRDGDPALIAKQLGRLPRGLVGVGARCVCGAPAVTVTSPRLPDGTPFPTLFYLTLPWVVRAVSRLEAAGEMVRFNDRLASDTEFAAAYELAHHSYLQRRALLGEVSEIAGVSAGGMPRRVKCLHALAGYSLAVGAGVCLVGDMTLEAVGWDPNVCRCSESDGVAEWEPGAAAKSAPAAGAAAEPAPMANAAAKSAPAAGAAAEPDGEATGNG